MISLQDDTVVRGKNYDDLADVPVALSHMRSALFYSAADPGVDCFRRIEQNRSLNLMHPCLIQ